MSAQVQKATPATSIAGAQPAKSKPKGTETEAQRLRRELREARLSHRLQKLDSTAKLRKLRRDLARALTREQATRIATSAKEQS